MGSSCSSLRTPVFTSLNLRGTDSKLNKQLSLRPGLFSAPVPGAFLGLHDTALHLASEQRNLPAVKQLLVFLSSADLDTAQAALQPYCRRLKLPLPSSPAEAVRLAVNAANNKGQTPLMYACYAGCADIVRELLAQGAHPWVADNCGYRNALHYAAMAGSTACIEALMSGSPPSLLVRQGQRLVNARSLSGLTPLHYAVAFNHTPAVAALLLHDPNINAGSTGESFDVWVTYDTLSTPLHFAAVKDNVAASALLLRHYLRHRRNGSLLDPRQRANSAGKLPWQLARRPLLTALLHPGMQPAAALAMPQVAAALRAYVGNGNGDGPAAEGEEDEGEVGPPTLAAIAAAALRQKLLASLEAIERECVEEAEEEEEERADGRGRQRSGRGSRILCGASSRRGGFGSTLPLSSSISRLSRLASGRLSRRGTASASMQLPATPRQAPSLDRLGSHAMPYDLVPGLIAPEDFLDGAASPQPQQQLSPQSRSAARYAAATATPAGGEGGESTLAPSPPLRPTGRTSAGGGVTGPTLQGRNSHRMQRSAERVTVDGITQQHNGNSSPSRRTVPHNGMAPSSSAAAFVTPNIGGGGPTGYLGSSGFPTSPFSNIAGGPILPGATASNGSSHRKRSASICCAPSLGREIAPGGVHGNTWGHMGRSNGGGGGGGGHLSTTSSIPAGGSPTSSERLFAVHCVGGGGSTAVRYGSMTPPAGASPTHGSGNGGGGGGGYYSSTAAAAAAESLSGAGAGVDPALPYPPITNMFSPAASLAAFGGGGGGGGSAFAVVNDGDIGGIGLYGNGGADDDVCGGSNEGWEDDGICSVCFARPEAAAPATCHHGICSVCAGELCRAVSSRPLLCPFCRQPVTDFVRVAAPAGGAAARAASGRRDRGRGRQQSRS
ncbi:hypothetical protein Agub_g5262 [Astrephomene gubernaculifera]|uniref:RING-type domain-containing protein n=1 Tax=Astrephomene gubernaculifera TaxID=47775 RepID=A0AAD3DLK6_9CHLO|nr:hypothetical protein Agub_g5262 [Astrephomene gubernaculifera]